MASVTSEQELAALRTELEIVLQFAAGATPQLVAAIDAQLTRLWTDDRADLGGRTQAVQDLQEIRGILCDAMVPANRRAIEEIDRIAPELRTRLSMDSIKKDAKQFRQDVTKQAKAAAPAADPNVDAMLAAFEQAADQAGDSVDAGLAALTGADAGGDDAAVEALLAEATQAASAGPAAAADPLESVEPPDAIEAITVVDPVEAAMAELAASAAEPESTAGAMPAAPVVPETPVVEADEPQTNTVPDVVADGLETVSQRVAESLTDAEQQLDAIASAFDAAAAELGQLTTDVQQVSEAAPAVQDTPADEQQAIDAETLAALTAWNQEPESDPAAKAPASAKRPATANVQATRTVELPSVSSSGASANSTPNRPTAEAKVQIQQARTRILSELDDVLAVLERVDQMQAQADQSMQRAKDFEQAAARAQETGECLAQAEAESAKARADFEQAQLRANSARQAWEQARQQASSAAAAVQPGR